MSAPTLKSRYRRTHPAVSLAIMLVIVVAGAGSGLLLKRQRYAKARTRSGAALERTICANPSRKPISLAEAPSGVATDPRSREYDFVQLIRLGVPASEVYEAEPRNPRWATSMESGLGQSLASDLASMFPGGVLDFQMECRTKSCRVRWTALDEETRNKSATALQFLQPMQAVTLVPTEDGRKAEAIMGYRPVEAFPADIREKMALLQADDPATYLLHYKSRRAGRLRPDFLPPSLAGLPLPPE
jgi:hypothetical protein